MERALQKSWSLGGWRSVALVQAAVLLALVLVLRAQSPAEAVPDIEEALVSLDVPRATIAVDATRAALQERVGSRILRTEQVEQTLGEAVARARFELQSMERTQRFEEAGALVAIERHTLVLEGSVFALPRMLEEIRKAGLYLAPTAIQVRSDAVGVDAKVGLVLVVDAFVPRRFDLGWVGPRLDQALPGADRAEPVLSSSAELLALRLLDEQSADLEALQAERFATLARVLPEGLIRLRKGGGALAWTPNEGLRYR